MVRGEKKRGQRTEEINNNKGWRDSETGRLSVS